MSTIAEAVSRNQARRARLDPTSVEPVVSGTYSVVEPASAPITFQPSPNLPLRSTFPPDLYAADQVTATSQPNRPTLRSSVWSQLPASGDNSTPETLTNKKLVAPVIGGGANLNRYNKLLTTVTPTSINANTQSTQTFTVGGVQASDTLAGYQWQKAQVKGVTVLAVRVVGANKIAIDFYNPTAGALVPTGGKILLFLLQ